MAEIREAMLRPEFRDWYPTLQADRWYPARQLADLVLEQRRSGEPRWELESRIPPDAHFLFRGGRPRGDTTARSRRSDRISNRPSPKERGPSAENGA
jgi:hypothetical protein